MRTTITFDKDVEIALTNYIVSSKTKFKKAINNLLRQALSINKKEPYILKSYDMGLKSGVDETSFNKLNDEEEIKNIVKKL